MVAVVVFAGCAPDPKPVGTSTPALVGANGIYQNGLTTNGIFQNGIFQNGIFQNGIFQNGIFQNGIYQNGIYQNGIYQNGIYQNGIYQNGLWQDALWQANPAAIATLRTNPYARKLLQYVYSCAIPSGRSTILDPGHLGACTSTTPTTSTTSTPCVHDSECPADETCLGGELQLTGSIGVGISSGASAVTWDLPGGTCDQSCQRWVSACLVARTNAYGAHVNISMRAPDNAPQAIKDALYASDTERNACAPGSESDQTCGYTLREGAYYGNLFQMTPVHPPDTSLSTANPAFIACAGPESSKPEITKRFCSSQGDISVIDVVGPCAPTNGLPSACQGIGASGAIHDCYTTLSESEHVDEHHYPEVITVYLKKPIEICGNGVCEKDEAAAATCPSDCHPGGWARMIDESMHASLVTATNVSGSMAVGPGGEVVRVEVSRWDVDLGGGTLPASPVGGFDLVVSKYAEDGRYLGGTRVPMPGLPAFTVFNQPGVAVGSDGSIVVAGVRETPADQVWIVKLDANGVLQSGWPVYTGGLADFGWTSFPWVAGARGSAALRVGVDGSGNLAVAGVYHGVASFGGYELTSPINPENGAYLTEGFVLKVASAGNLAALPITWAARRQGVVESLSIASGGDVLVGGHQLDRINGATGVKRWTKSHDAIYYAAAIEDSSGNLYVTGSFSGNLDLGDGVLRQAAGSESFFVMKYTSTGAVAWITTGLEDEHCYENRAIDCSMGFAAYRLGLDAYGNITVGGMGGSNGGGSIDFGAGPFEGYRTNDIFIASFKASNGTMSWSKQVPLILEGWLQEMVLSPSGRVVVAGAFSGSMMVDGRMVVAVMPETDDYYDSFLASFATPVPETVAPVLGHLPQNIVLEATERSGAAAWYVQPTALDDSNQGLTVNCFPSPGWFVPIGVSTVTCTASDVFGNKSTGTFTVRVRDSLGPVFTSVPANQVLEPTSASGAIATFALPTAEDQLDGVRPVTCSRASGSVFPVGRTTVTCTASDASNNVTHVSFTIKVRDHIPPVLTLPGALSAEAQGAWGAAIAYTASAMDNVDGAITPACTPASGSTFALGTTTVTCRATDEDGNTATGSFTVTIVDTTPPAISTAPVSAEAQGPQGATVTYSVTAVDAVDGAVTASCTPASGGLFPLGDTTVSCSATDAHGNSATATFTVSVVDTTPPAVTVPATKYVVATSVAGAVASYSASAVDLVDGAVTPICTPASGSTFALGSTTVTCSATDAHGNTGTASFQIWVQYAWSGILQPINDDGSSVFKLGSTIPVKFQLTGDSAGITNAVANLTLTRVSSGVSGDIIEATSTAAADSGNTFRYDATSHQYIFNLATRGLSTGTWRLSIDLHDGATRVVMISLRN